MDPTNPLSSNTWTAVGPAGDRRPRRRAATPRSPAGSAAIAVDPSDPSGNTVYVGGAQRRDLEDDQLPHDGPDGPDLRPADRLRPDLRRSTSADRRLPPQQRPEPVDHLRRHRRRRRAGDPVAPSREPGRHPQPRRRLPPLDGRRATWTLLDSTDNTLPFAQRDHFFASRSRGSTA